MFQILGCSLAKALTDFCGQQGKELAAKIEFKDEILFIMNNYKQNPEILKPSVISAITKRKFIDERDENGRVVYKTLYKDLGKSKCLYDEVIRYADNDTQVLPVLYKSVDAMCKEVLGANITSFLTAGSIAWYGFVSHLPSECLEAKYTESRHKIGIINSKLYRCEQSQENFIRSSIKGGRVCPR